MPKTPETLLAGFDHAILAMQPYQGGDAEVSQAVTFFQDVKAEIQAELASEAASAPPITLEATPNG